MRLVGELYYLLDEEKRRKNKQNTLLLSIFPHNRNSLLIILENTDYLMKNAWYKGNHYFVQIIYQIFHKQTL